MSEAERGSHETEETIAGAGRAHTSERVIMTAKGRKGAAGSATLEISIEELGRKLEEREA